MLLLDPPATKSTLPEEFSASPNGPANAHAPPTLPTFQTHAPLASEPLTLPVGQLPGQVQDTGGAAPPAHVCPAGQGAPPGEVEPGVQAEPGAAAQMPVQFERMRPVAAP